MPSIKEYDTKLKSLKNTQKMTRTMKMVSASKLRKAQELQRNAKDYAARLSELIARLAATVDSAAHPLLTARPSRRALVLVYTSDRGLCGGFNNGMIKFVNNWLEDNRERYDEIEISCCGRRGFAFFNGREPILNHYEGATHQPSFATATHIGNELAEAFLSGSYGEIHLAYNLFVSPLAQTPSIRQLLPVEGAVLEGGSAMSSDYIFEPDKSELLEDLVPRAVFFAIYNAFLENAAGEHGARMTAMDNATSNADDLISEYTLRRNRARQAAITTELTEIVAGAEAL
jgi:F-type H+-transporting ATPase subunit gamma